MQYRNDFHERSIKSEILHREALRDEGISELNEFLSELTKEGFSFRVKRDDEYKYFIIGGINKPNICFNIHSGRWHLISGKTNPFPTVFKGGWRRFIKWYKEQ